MADAKYSRYYTYIKPAVENKYVRSSAPYIFSIFTITILIVFAIRPTISTILNLQKSLNDSQKVLQDLNNKADSLATAKRNYDSISPDAKLKIKNAVPEQTEITTIISSLKSASLNAASTSAMQIQPVTIIDNTVAPGKTKMATGDVSFSYNVQGSFSELLAILGNISKTQRLISIDNIVIGKQTEEKTTIISINGKAFFLK